MDKRPNELWQTRQPEAWKRIVAAMESSKWQWRTLDGVAKETGLSAEVVRKIVESDPKTFIRSTAPHRGGKPLYTTRRHYKRTHGPFERLVDISSSTST